MNPLDCALLSGPWSLSLDAARALLPALDESVRSEDGASIVVGGLVYGVGEDM